MSATFSDPAESSERKETSSAARAATKVGRMPDETWVEWIQRATHIAEDHLRKAKVDDWVTKSRRLKWTWAGHAARRTDGRWSTALLCWEPNEGRRRAGRPIARWRDDLDTFTTDLFDVEETQWILLAQEREEWDCYKDEYASHLHRR